MIILIGPSASGKTEVVKELIKTNKFKKLVTYTTREMRPQEVNGVDYHFISFEDFNKMIEDNLFFEYVKYNNNYYGTLKEDITDEKVVILEPNGFKSYHNSNIPNLISFFLSSSENKRREWMTSRKDDPIKIEERIKSDRVVFDINNIEGIDFIIDSDNSTVTQMSKEIEELYLRRIGRK